MDITSVADDLVVMHDGLDVRRYEGLAADTDHDLDGIAVRTLARPAGELLCRFATVNDVHFGETEAGRIDDLPDGPIRRAEAGADPYPEVMNRAAAAEIAGIDPVAVIVKGDLSADGEQVEWDAFEACYRAPFGHRLHVVRGNHDAYRHQAEYAGDQWIDLPGVVVALLDTAIPGATTGTITSEQIDWLDDRCAGADRPVFVMGHHQQWIGDGPDAKRSDDYFGLHPDAATRWTNWPSDGPASSPTRPGTPTATGSVRWFAPVFRRSRSAARRTSRAPGRSTASTRAGSCRSCTGCPPGTRCVERVVPRPLQRLRRRLRHLRPRYPRRPLLHPPPALTESGLDPAPRRTCPGCDEPNVRIRPPCSSHTAPHPHR